jgi:hypothetical protein
VITPSITGKAQQITHIDTALRDLRKYLKLIKDSRLSILFAKEIIY